MRITKSQCLQAHCISIKRCHGCGAQTLAAVSLVSVVSSDLVFGERFVIAFGHDTGFVADCSF